MTTQAVTARVRLAAIGAAAPLVAGLIGCQAFGVVPGADLAPDASVPGTAISASLGGLGCIGTCTPDPGSRAISEAECDADRKLDKLTLVSFDDVNPMDITPTEIRASRARNIYTYTDSTALLHVVYGSSLNDLRVSVKGWEAETERTTLSFHDPVDLCGPPAAIPGEIHRPDGSNYAFHVVGAYQRGLDGNLCDRGPGVPQPFRGWGGGMGISMMKLNGRDNTYGDSGRALCKTPGGPHAELCPPVDGEYPVSLASLDISSYDGISFWARRGPDSQASIRVGAGDKYTDDDQSYLSYRQDPKAPRYCERIRQCSCGNHKACVYKDPGPCQQLGANALTANYYCDPPDPNGSSCALSAGATMCMSNGSNPMGGSSMGGGSTVYCTPTGVSSPNPGVGACNLEYPAFAQEGMGDPAFVGRPCTTYTWPDGNGGDFCFDPATDPPPAPSSQQCGDHWMTIIDLSTDWQFFKVPFTELRQQGWAKRFDHLDLHSLSVVRFTWDAGWIDYWIDDLSFYRNPK